MASLYQTFVDEIANDPLTRGYSGMTDQQVADSLNTVDRAINKTYMSASEVLNAVLISEYNTLTDTQKDQMWRLLAIGDLNPFGIEADVMVDLFGGGSTTVSTLQSLRKTDVSRATELGLSYTVDAASVAVWRA